MNFTLDINRVVSFPKLHHVQAKAESAFIPDFENKSLCALASGFIKEIPAIGYFILKDVYVLGNGYLHDQEGRRIQSQYLPYTHLKSKEGVKRSAGPVVENSNNLLTTNRSVTEIEEPVALLTQPGDRIFGHWLVDLLPKLSMINQYDPNIRCIIKSDVLNRNAIADIDAIFKLAGFSKHRGIDIRPAKDAIFCRQLIVPSVVRYGQQIHSYVNKLYEPFRSSRFSEIGPKKLYFSRRLWKPSGEHRVLANAIAVEEYYSSEGYKIIHPENLSLQQKFDLLLNASHIVGEKGSALHLSLFSNSIKEMTVLINPAESATGLPLLQSEICRQQGIKCNLVVGLPKANNAGYIVPMS